MKKQTNIETLKMLVNNSFSERVKLCTVVVKAYNIAEGEEYCVIKAFAKINGRYYFIDREDRRYLASRYDRAEFVAGEMLEIIANDAAAAEADADQIERAGSVLVDAELLPLFFAECDRRGLKVKSTAVGFDDLGRMLTRYDRVSPTNDQQTDHNDSTSTTSTSTRCSSTSTTSTSTRCSSTSTRCSSTSTTSTSTRCSSTSTR